MLAGVANKNGEEGSKIIQLRFIDSWRFMASSLDKLIFSFDNDQCKNCRGFYTGEEVFKLMRHKDIYSYEYMDTVENLNQECILKQVGHEIYQ